MAPEGGGAAGLSVLFAICHPEEQFGKLWSHSVFQ